MKVNRIIKSARLGYATMRHMIIVRLKGGMGNQMFQYALGRALSIKNNTELLLDTSFYKNPGFPVRTYDLGVFNIAAQFATPKDIPFLYRTMGGRWAKLVTALYTKILPTPGVERFFHFDPSKLMLGPNAYLDGYWQSPRYFAQYEDVIRRDFTLKLPPSGEVAKLQEEISGVHAVCIHIRRTDYVTNSLHNVVGTEYYTEGIARIAEKTQIDAIYVFSDDIQWCKEHLSFAYKTVFVGDVYAGTKGEWHMMLMSSAKYFVIPNSSFSWWAAWLATYPEKIVIAPKQWFTDDSIDSRDVTPAQWIRI